MTEKILLKDLLFNTQKITQIAEEIQRVYPQFKKLAFIQETVKAFPTLELKARIAWIAECLKKYLPEYEEALKILIASLPPPNNPELTDDDFGDFIYATYGEYVARYGCARKHLNRSLQALYQITQRFSAEDAIRSFINAFPEKTLNMLLTWSNDSQYHVRRLCSEGTRPKLPWSKNIVIPVTAPLSILDNLFFDSTRYVTRSVANHLNDISKINSDLTCATLIRWQKSKKQKPKEMEFIIRHALRTLIKRGDKKALKMLGFSTITSISLSNFSIPKKVSIGSALLFSCTLTASEKTRAVVNYTLYFQSKNGLKHNKKIFALKTLDLQAHTPVTLKKRHPLRRIMTTRTLYPGKHEIALHVNGIELHRTSFLLV